MASKSTSATEAKEGKENQELEAFETKYKSLRVDLQPGKLPCIATGILTLERAIEQPGFPRGKIIELYGDESTGKSLLAQTISVQVLKDGGKVAYLDYENSLTADHLLNIGIDPANKNFKVYHPDTMEKGFDVCYDAIKLNQFDFIVFDSVAVMQPKSALDAETGEQRVGGVALPLSLCLRKLLPMLNPSAPALLFINQFRTNIKTSPYASGPMKITPGGNALKFDAHLRIELRKVGVLKDSKDRPVGIDAVARITKNKVGLPGAEAKLTIMGGTYDLIADVVDILIEEGFVQVNGSIITCEAMQYKVRGRQNFLTALRDNKELRRGALHLCAHGVLPQDYVHSEVTEA